MKLTTEQTDKLLNASVDSELGAVEDCSVNEDEVIYFFQEHTAHVDRVTGTVVFMDGATS